MAIAIVLTMFANPRGASTTLLVACEASLPVLIPPRRSWKLSEPRKPGHIMGNQDTRGRSSAGGLLLSAGLGESMSTSGKGVGTVVYTVHSRTVG
jgi:hypothetical protein